MGPNIRVILIICLQLIVYQGTFGDESSIELESLESKAEAFKQQSFAYLYAGETDSSFAYARRALTVAKSGLSISRVTSYTIFCAYIARAINFPKSALNFCNTALGYMSVSKKTAANMVYCHRIKGLVYQSTGAFYRAEHSFNEAIQISSTFNLPYYDLQIELATLFNNMGYPEKALHLYQKTITSSSLDSIPPETLLIVRGNIVGIHLEQMDLTQAELEYKPIADVLSDNHLINKSLASDFYKTKSGLFYLKGDFKIALSAIQKALDLVPTYDSRKIFKLNTDKAKILLASGKLKEALNLAKLTKNDLKTDKGSSTDPYQMVVTKLCADVYYQMAESDNQFIDSALVYVHQVGKIAEDMKSQLSFQQSQFFLAEYLSSSSQLGLDLAVKLWYSNSTDSNLNQIFQFMEASKNQVLNAEIREQSLASSFNKKQLNRLRDHKMLLIEAKDNVTKINLQTKILAVGDSLKSTLMEMVQKNKENITIADAQNKLNQDEVLVEFGEGQTALYSLTISKGKKTFRTLTQSKDSIRSLAHRYSLMVQNPNTPVKDFLNLSSELYQMLLPISIEASTITLVTSQSLHQVPFSSLVVKKTEARNYKQLNYLVKDYDVRYALSCTQYIQSIKPCKILGKIAAIVLRNDEEGDLQHHTHFLSDHISANGGFFFQNDPISIADISTTYGIIHFSSHSVYETKNDTFRYIKLPNKKELSLEEIYATHLENHPLIVLNSCETGKGKIVTGEGILNFTRAFSHSGAGSIIEASWKVNVQTTSQIFNQFYVHLNNHKNSSSSLNRAMTDYLKSDEVDNHLSHPYYWAGFKHFGSSCTTEERKDRGGLYFTILALISVIIGLAYFTIKKKQSGLV
ncbi:MAG: hypothetical protein COA58_13315 [Bacteroidetes bacterium]|nr:MAG: hypothetical protein COA58_13315 [Bacteroidota bacterium]